MRLTVALMALCSVAACSSAGQVPLGGPYGGTLSASAEGGVVIIIGGSSDSGSNDSGSGDSGVAACPAGNAGSCTGTPSASAPTWTQLFNNYLAAGTVGNCAGAACHPVTCGTAATCFTWMGCQGQGGLTNCQGGGLFTWDQSGYMPPSGPTTNAQAEADFTAWILAGSLDN